MCDFKGEKDWRVIPGYGGRYWVSNFGEIYTTSYGNPRPKRLCVTKTGYIHVDLQKHNVRKKLSVHRIIYSLFAGKVGSKIDIHHIDGNRKNNSIHNLEAIEHGEHNRIHSLAMKSFTTSRLLGVYWSSKRKMWVSRISRKGKSTQLCESHDEQYASFVHELAYEHVNLPTDKFKEKVLEIRKQHKSGQLLAKWENEK